MKNDANDFKAVTNSVVNELSRYLTESQNGTIKTLTQRLPEEIAEQMQLEKWLKEGGLNSKSATELTQSYLDNTQHMHHPHYIGHQVAVPHVATGIADLVHGVINNPMSIYEMGPAGATIERFLINWMLNKIGWFKGEKASDFRVIEGNGGGILTHGGSVANLTAMSAARAAIAPDSWTQGTPNNLVVLASEEAHYSISRALSIMGMGQNSIIPVKVNKFKVMQPEYLIETYQNAINQGKKVMAVVANGCTTATGLYDPLEKIGHFCQEHNLWYHVDGAHGASALLSEKEKHHLKGIELANSVIWDAHKMLRTSSLCAAVLFKDFKTLGTTFQQKGSYLFHNKEDIGFDSLPYTLECTKAGLGTKLFWVLAAEGEKGLTKYVEDTYQITREFHDIINQHIDFSCPYFPESNILCFEYTKFGRDNEFQLAIRNELTKQGKFYITSTEMNDIRYLRLTVMNTLTKSNHIEALLDEIIKVAHTLK